MKLSRRQKQTVSIVMVLTVMLTMLTVSAGTPHAAGASLSYSFSNALAGYAQGTVILTGSGNYWLYWADDTQALDGFAPLATLSVSGSKTYTMPAQTAVPAGATKLIAVQSSGEPSNTSVGNAAAVYPIPANKQFGRSPGQRRYRFLSYSDVHFDALYRTYQYDETHWAHALQTAADRQVDFMVGSGDYVNNNIDYPEPWADEWSRYQRILAESDYCNPVYEAIGNHELWHDVAQGTQTFIKETGLEGDNGSASKAYFEKNINGDHFLFMALEGGFYPNQVSEFTTAQLDWLQARLQQYSGDGGNIYIIEHSLFYKYGAGDRTDSTPYYDIPLSDSQSSTNRLKTLLQTYKDAIFITGHTHIAFDEQYNYSDNGGTSAQMIHNSSVGGVRHVSGGSLTHDYAEDEAEGYIVDVFDNGIIFHGTDLYHNKIDPNCTYLVKTSQQIAGGAVPTQGTTAPTTTPAPTTTAPPATVPTTVPPTTTFTGSPTSYYLKGSFNSWGTENRFYTTQDSDVVSCTVELNANTYQFKINFGSTWYGNNGTIYDTTKKTSNGGWVMSSNDGNCTLVASGGTYTFNYILSTHKLNVLWSGYAVGAVNSGIHTQTTVYQRGDTTGDGNINVKDVTAIQRFLAQLKTFDAAEQAAADTNSDGSITIKDATVLQQYLAEIISAFPTEPSTQPVQPTTDGVSDQEKITLLNNVQQTLQTYYRYASYDSYQALKKEYRADKELQNAGNLAQVNAAQLQNRRDILLGIVDPANVDSGQTTRTVYFENNYGWSTVKAYVWGNQGAGAPVAWPGSAMQYVGVNDYGHAVYSLTVTDPAYKNVIFNNGGSEQTQDLRIYRDSLAFYISDNSNPHYCKGYLFKNSYVH